MLLLLLHIHVHVLTSHSTYSLDPTSFPPTITSTLLNNETTTTPKFIPQGTPGSSETLPLTSIRPVTAPMVEDEETFSQSTLILLLGEDGVINCNGYQDDILWYKDEQFVQNYTSDIVAVDGSDVENAGQYACRVANKTFITNVFIVGPEPLISPISNNSTIKIKELSGDPLNFNISINVYPIGKLNISATFARVVDDISMETLPGVDITDKIKLTGNVLEYKVDQVDWNVDNGYYNLEVQYGTQRYSILFCVSVLEEARIKQFRKLPKFVEVGNTASIKARVTGHPPPVLVWFHKRCCIEDDIVNINDVLSSEESSDFYSIRDQTLTLSAPSAADQQYLNGSYWFEVEHPVTSNLSSLTTYYNIKGWGIDVATPNTTLYENMGEFIMSCRTQTGGLQGKYTLKIMQNGDVLNYIPNLNFDDNNETVVYNVSSVTASFKGIYQCIAESDNVTLWSSELEVQFVPQPHFIVSPREYSITSGSTAIFSCLVKGVDSADHQISFLAGSNPSALTSRDSSPEEPAILYLPSVTETEFVRCETPHFHPNPVYNTVTTKIVQEPLVVIEMSITKSPFHKTGDTVVIKCDIASNLLSSDSPPEVYWKHKGKKYSYNGSKGNVHMYDNGVTGNTTTHILAIQDVDHALHNGTYTCIIVSEEAGRYEDTLDIIIKRGLTKNVIALILGCSLLFLIVTLILVVVLLVRLKYRRGTQFDDTADCTVATNTLVKNEVVQSEGSPEVTAM